MSVHACDDMAFVTDKGSVLTILGVRISIVHKSDQKTIRVGRVKYNVLEDEWEDAMSTPLTEPFDLMYLHSKTLYQIA